MKRDRNIKDFFAGNSKKSRCEISQQLDDQTNNELEACSIPPDSDSLQVRLFNWQYMHILYLISQMDWVCVYLGIYEFLLLLNAAADLHQICCEGQPT